MEFDTRSIDTLTNESPLAQDDLPSDFFDTFTAAKTMALAAENSNSKWNYYEQSAKDTVQKLIEADPENAQAYKMYGEMSPGYSSLYSELYKSGQTIPGNQFDRKVMGFNAFKMAQEKASELGLDTYESIMKKAEQSAFSDYTQAKKTADKGNWFPELLGGMYGAMHDPLNLMLLPAGAEASAATALGRAGQRFVQEAAIATVAEVPIQMQSFEWKNDIGLEWDMKNAFATGALSIGAAGVLGAGAGAFFDVVLPKKPITAEEKFVDNLMANRIAENPDEHVLNMQTVKAQVESGFKPDVGDRKISEAPDISAEIRNINQIENDRIFDANDFDDEVVAWADQNKADIEGYADFEAQEAGIKRIMECAI